MTRRHTAILLVVGALALLGASLAWATTRTPSTGHHYGYGPGMMGYGYTTQKASPVSGIADARARAQTYADKLGLRTGEVLRFQRNYYVQLVDTSGTPATEVLVDPATGAVGLEFGPAMMWNTRYGMMSGRLGAQMMSAEAMRQMMGRYGGDYSGMMGRGSAGMMNGNGAGMMGGTTPVPGTHAQHHNGQTPGGMMGGGSGGMMGGTTTPAAPSTSGNVSLARAHELTQTWLDRNEPGLKAEPGGDAFPGYFTLETLRDGRIAGMISVNASSGAVWPHWWHGNFVEASA
jgi:hypothetical protein